jgi:MT0933-like antitoxin protein
MGLTDRLKDLKTKATDAAAEHSEKINDVVEKAASTADQRTGGKYHEQIQKAGAKAGNLVDGLKGSDQQPAAAGRGATDGQAAADSEVGT